MYGPPKAGGELPGVTGDLPSNVAAGRIGATGWCASGGTTIFLGKEGVRRNSTPRKGGKQTVQEK